MLTELFIVNSAEAFKVTITLAYVTSALMTLSSPHLAGL